MSNRIKGVDKPYYRIYRSDNNKEHNKDNNDHYTLSDNSYLLDNRYANDRYSLLRAYKIIEEDLLKLFQYIEPNDKNKNTFSQRTYELLLRASTEFETNCKQILKANNYKKSSKKNWNICDYKKIEKATKLSEYEIKLNIWYPESKTFQPLDSWKNEGSLGWYNDYNNVKHDRSRNFENAKLINVINAVSAVWAILYAQFGPYVFERAGIHTVSNKFENSSDTLFDIKPFSNWNEDEKYIFDWPIKSNTPFQKFNF